MFNKIKTVLMITVMLLSLTACGKGENTTATGAATATVSGVASKGPIAGGTVTITDLGGRVLGTGTTNSDGSYSVSIFGYKGPVIIKIAGGSYIDEATGSTVMLAATMPNGMRAVFGNASSATRVTVTPLTEIAAQKAVNMGLSRAAITTANSAVSTAFGIDNIITTMPVTPAGFPSTTPTPAESYATALANISKMVQLQPIQTRTVTGVIDANFGPGKINDNGTFLGGVPADLTTANTQPRLTFWPNKSSGFTTNDRITLYAKGGQSGVTQVTFTVYSGQALLNDNLSPGSQGTTVTKTTADYSFMGATTPLADVSVTGTGTATIKATFLGGTTAFTTVSFIGVTGQTTLNVSLTPAGIAALQGKLVKNMAFNLVNANSSVISLFQTVTDRVGFNWVEHSAATTQTVLYTAAGKTVDATNQPMLTLKYGYNPLPPLFTVVPVGNVTFTDGTQATLTSSHFIIN